jgi:histone H3/H4
MTEEQKVNEKPAVAEATTSKKEGSMSTQAGLELPVSRIKVWCKSVHGKRMGEEAAVANASALEYLSEVLIKESMRIAHEKDKKRITSTHLQMAAHNLELDVIDGTPLSFVQVKPLAHRIGTAAKKRRRSKPAKPVGEGADDDDSAIKDGAEDEEEEDNNGDDDDDDQNEEKKENTPVATVKSKSKAKAVTGNASAASPSTQPPAKKAKTENPKTEVVPAKKAKSSAVAPVSAATTNKSGASLSESTRKIGVKKEAKSTITTAVKESTSVAKKQSATVGAPNKGSASKKQKTEK